MAVGEISWGRLLGPNFCERCILCGNWMCPLDAALMKMGAFILPGHIGPFCVVHLADGAKALQRLLEAGAAWWSRCELAEGEPKPHMPALVLPAGNYARLVTLLDNLRNGGYPG